MVEYGFEASIRHFIRRQVKDYGIQVLYYARPLMRLYRRTISSRIECRQMNLCDQLMVQYFP